MAAVPALGVAGAIEEWAGPPPHAQLARLRPVEHDPEVGLAIIDPAVTYCFAVVGLGASRHENELQRHPVRLVQDRVRAHLNRSAPVDVGKVCGVALLFGGYDPRDPVGTAVLTDLVLSEDKFFALLGAGIFGVGVGLRRWGMRGTV